MNDREKVRALFVHVPENDAGAERRALERLRAHIATSRPETQAPPGPQRHPARRTVVGAAAFVLLMLGAMILLPARRDGPSIAAGLLVRLASTAAAQPSGNLRPGDYVYTRSQELHSDSQVDLETGASWNFVVTVVRESWFAADGSGRIVTVYGEPAFVSETDRDAWRAAGSPPLIPGERTDEMFPAGEFPSPDLSRMPVDPQALRKRLAEDLRRRGADGDSVFNAVGRLLSETDASPELRTALFEVAASLPGVTEVGDVNDPLGRSGVAVEQARDGVSTRLIFDLSTSALLAIEHRRGDQLESWLSYEESRVVPSLGS
jgi:hypothetical protein